MEDYRKNSLSTSPKSMSIYLMMSSDNSQTQEASIPDDSGDYTRYHALPYLFNYIPLQNPTEQDGSHRNILSNENEYLLKKYYSIRRVSVSSNTITNKNSASATSVNGRLSLSDNQNVKGSTRQNSVVSNSDTAEMMKSDRHAMLDIVDAFLNSEHEYSHTYSDDTADVILNEKVLNSHSNLVDIKNKVTSSNCVAPYHQYIKKLNSANDKRDEQFLCKQTLWVPIAKNSFKEFVLQSPNGISDLYENKTSPLFIQGLNLFNDTIDPFRGLSRITSIFGEQKMPSLLYHTSASCGDNIYVFGGIMACNKYDEDAPDLKDFKVSGIKNLPPPLLPSIVNNPVMINNPHLYVISNVSKSLIKPKLSGQVPPPLCAAKASNITDRHIFIYGGFEIKCDTMVDKNGMYCISKKIYINKYGYILDVATFKFTKIDIIANAYDDILYPTILPRFGQIQMAVNSNTLSLTSFNTPSVSRKTTLDAFADSHKSAEAVNLDEKPSSAKSNLHQLIIASIYVFGGYTESTELNSYEALGDFWKIELSIEARGKRGYLKFNETAQAIKIVNSGSEEGPTPRAFAASSYIDMQVNDMPDYQKLEKELIDNLENNFHIVDDINGSTDKRSTRPEIQSINSSMKLSNKTIESNSSSSTNEILQHKIESIEPHPQTFNQIIKTHKEKSKNFTHYFVLQGGSDNLKVYGDLWFFNFITETWFQKDLLIRNKDDGSYIPLPLPLVGHSLTSEGDIGMSIGGLSQAAVDYLYKNNITGRNQKEKDQNLYSVLGSSMINSYNLKTGKLQFQQVEKAEYKGYGDYQLVPERTATVAIAALYLGCNIVEINGILYIIGGAVAQKKCIDKMYVKGAIEAIISPSVNLFP